MQSTELVGAATKTMNDALQSALGESWDVPSGDVTWSCRDTAAHVADDLFSYASQVLAQPADGYLPIEVVVDKDATNRQLMDAVVMCGALLQNAVVLTPSSSRGWHPNGTSDPHGFAAMGAVEVLVHTYDIAQGLGFEWRPPTDLSRAVLDRLFPDAPEGAPGDVLLYCCGRAPLGTLPRKTSWAWDSSVRAEGADH